MEDELGVRQRQQQCPHGLAMIVEYRQVGRPVKLNPPPIRLGVLQLVLVLKPLAPLFEALQQCRPMGEHFGCQSSRRRTNSRCITAGAGVKNECSRGRQDAHRVATDSPPAHDLLQHPAAAAATSNNNQWRAVAGNIWQSICKHVRFKRLEPTWSDRRPHENAPPTET